MDEIRLSLPAVPEFARLARLTVAGLASRIGFSYDEVEDLRIAIGEACSLLVQGVQGAPDGGVLELTFVVRPESLDVTVTNVGGTPDAAGQDEAGLSHQILGAVVDRFEVVDTTVSLTKLRSA